MDSMQFVSDLVIQFKDKKDSERNRVFYENLSTFSGVCPENHLQDVYNFIIQNHKYSTPFQVAKIWGFAKEKGFIADSVQQRDNVPAWWECTSCFVTYSFDGRGCPKCGEHNRKLHTDENYPDKMIGMTEDCFHCNVFYDGIIKYKRKIYGGTCGKFGQAQDDMCKGCPCSQCCYQKRLYDENPHRTIDMIESGELKQLWMMDHEPVENIMEKIMGRIKR